MLLTNSLVSSAKSLSKRSLIFRIQIRWHKGSHIWKRNVAKSKRKNGCALLVLSSIIRVSLVSCFLFLTQQTQFCAWHAALESGIPSKPGSVQINGFVAQKKAVVPPTIPILHTIAWFAIEVAQITPT